MGRRAKHWLQIVVDSGLPGLTLVIVACLAVTYRTAQTIDADEHAVAAVGIVTTSIVAAYRLWSTNRKARK